ncbi:MAG: GTPase domain-containing protein [Planctomycetaceae bacterium]|jgi:hypothetical protein|nr:GTPase domain-containing protein [Planctomycetaceae bacterium]
MNELFQESSTVVRQLADAIHTLDQRASLLKLQNLNTHEWHETLRQKLLPQLGEKSFLIAAVVGGTNIGKSVIFNHLAGFSASEVCPLASGTKHATCLVPPGFTEEFELAQIFSDFKLESWSDASKAIMESDEHYLFWKTSQQTPENLLILDTPDVDSDAPVNWDRADMIRRASDVLIAVLTQQKYNDAVVKKFFRKAAAEDKAILVVFNQCDLPDDEEYWPLWLEKFCSETDILPEFVYLAPRDKQAAQENRLPFYQRSWPIQPEENRHQAHSLLEDLSQLHFADIKLRSLRGSLRSLMDEELGIPAWLNEIRQRSGVYQSATAHLGDDQLAGSEHWPAAPNSLVVDLIRQWWRDQREGWSRSVHDFYNSIGKGVVWPYKKAKESFSGPEEPLIEVYRKKEWSAILETVKRVFDRLEFMSETDNKVLSDRLKSLLDGKSRSDLFRLLENSHTALDLEQEMRETVATEMKKFHQDSPQSYQFFKRIDQISAAVRPATSVALFMVGFGPAGDAAAQVVAHSALGSVVHVAGDVVGGAAVAAVGETAVSSGASSLSANLESRFRALHAIFVARRVTWLLEQLQDNLWGSFLEDLQTGAGMCESEEFKAVDDLTRQLQQTIETLEVQTSSSSPTTTE